MPNILDGNGLQIQEYTEIVSDIVNGTPTTPGYIQIYGADINVDSNTPDGQKINILALSKKDVLGLLQDIYLAFDPDQAAGVSLDGISQLCGATRKGGTYTETAVVVTTDRNINLNGLDTSTPFTISDANGNQFNLISSASLTTGANTLNFRSANVGFVQVLQNTLTRAVTIVLGVITVNNPNVPYSIGQNQETDAIFRVRRQKSTALPAHGFLHSLFAGLNTVSGLLQAVIYENNTSAVDVNSVPAHSVWIIVDGGTDADVGAMIYRYKNAGAGMKGAEVVNITQIDGTTYTVYFDRAVYEDLYIQFTATSLTGGSIDTAALKTALAAAYKLGIYDVADITTVTALVKAIDPTILVTLAGVSHDGATWVNSKFPADRKTKWVVTAAKITVN